MRPIADLSMLRAVSPRRAAAGTNPETEGAKPQTGAQATGQAEFPSTALPGPGERKLALWVALVSAAVFVVAVPYAREPLAQVWAFIPIYQSALTLNELITAAAVRGQFPILRARRCWCWRADICSRRAWWSPTRCPFRACFAPGA